MVSGMGGPRNYTPLSHQLAKQEERSLLQGLQATDPASGMDTVTSMSDPEVISDDDGEWRYHPVE